MSFKYEKIEDNIYKYKTKSGKVKYRVKITIEYIPFDKSGLANISSARAFIKQATADVLNGEYSKNKPKEYTFGEYWEYYLDKKTTLKGSIVKADWNETTKSNAISLFNNHILPTFKDMQLKDITRMQLEQFSESLIYDKNLRTASAETVMTMLSNLLSHAVENEILDRNRCLNVSPPSSDLAPINKELSFEDFLTLSDYYSKREIGLKIRFSLLSLGLRSAELSGIRVKSIEFIPNKEAPKTARITIDKSRPRYYQKEGKQTKTNRPRVIYATERIAIELAEYLDWLKGVYKKKDKVLHADDWLIVNLKTMTPVGSSTVYSELRASGDKLGITVSPHLLRHHFSTQAKLEGIDIRHIADMLGHKSLATTEGYTHGEEQSAKYISERVTFL